MGSQPPPNAASIAYDRKILMDELARPSAIRLWQQAERENPVDDEARGRRYRELLTEHGYLIEADDHERVTGSRDLPCGWPHRDGRH